VSSSKRPSKKPSGARDSPRAPQTVKSRGQASRAATDAKKTPPKVRRPAPKAAPRAAPQAARRPRPEPPLPPPKPLPVRPASPTPRPGIRLAGSASSRLTIKPSPPQGPRPQLELSTKVRPGGPRRLSEVELDEDEVLIDGFDATLDGERVRITAVLERTCVYVDRGGDRRLAKKDELWVEADKLPIRRRGLA
jgi:hypothetical protein